MFIDTHCHLNFPEYNTDRKEVITRAKKVGVKHMIIPGVDRYSSEEVVRLVQTFPQDLSAAAGFHPYEAQKTDVQDAIGFLDKIAGTQSIIAIGECGLDYHLYKGHVAISKKDKQKILFEAHLKLAIKHDLPVIIHCRDAFEDIFPVLDSLPTMPKGVFHCFGGGLADLREVLKHGFYIGIDGNVTYNKTVQAVAAAVPLDRLLLETDSPYLTPVPHRGTRNEPKNIRVIANFIGVMRNENMDTLANQTTINARSLFGIS